MIMDLILDIANEKIWRPGSKKIMNLTRVPMDFKRAALKLFTIYMANEYSRLLRLAITTQRFIRLWEPLTKTYLAHKRAMGWSLKIWEATAVLKDSITWWTVPNGYAIGVDHKAMYKTETGKILPVRDVACWLEYGTGERAEGGKGTPGWPGMPPRPLFRPLRDRMSRDIDVWFDLFVEEYGDEIDELLCMVLAGFEPQLEVT